MPELPEVEGARRTVERHLLRSKITKVVVREQGGGPRDGQIDDIVLSCVDPEAEVAKFLLGKSLVAARRKGKQLYFEISGGGHLLFHFGMTGSFVVEGEVVPTYKSVKVDDTSYPPKFTKLELQFSNGRKVSFADPRRLGRVKIIMGDPLTQEPLRKLARDPVIDGVGDDFPARIAKFSLPIKALLLDQERVISGIGNYLADEVLYQSGIHPKCPCSSLPEQKAQELARVIERVVATACELTATNVDFPPDWLFHYRWEKGKGERSKMPDGSLISYETVGGRTSAFVPSVQKMTFPSSSSSGAGTEEQPKKKKAKTSKS